MVQITFNGKVITNADNTVVVENNHYFPPKTIKAEGFTLVVSRSVCPWKGEAFYNEGLMDGKTVKDIAW